MRRLRIRIQTVEGGTMLTDIITKPVSDEDAVTIEKEVARVTLLVTKLDENESQYMQA